MGCEKTRMEKNNEEELEKNNNDDSDHSKIIKKIKNKNLPE